MAACSLAPLRIHCMRGPQAGVLAAARELIGADQVLEAGGCGNKVLQLLLGRANVALMNLKTSLWDTCATEAPPLPLPYPET